MKKTLAIVLVLAVMFSLNIGGFHVHEHAHAEDGWYCPDCGSWARGSECWNCGFTLQPGPQFVDSTPIESNDIEGWYCPDCGSWARGSECWNCGFTLQPGPQFVDSTPIESNDIQGWTCPVCGSWARGNECWNCGYTQGSYYFGVTTVPTYVTTTVSTGAPAAAPAGGTTTVPVNYQENSVVGQQITFIASKFSELKQDDSDGAWFYTVTDLDHNGLLELVATKVMPNGVVKLKVWEVNLNGNEMLPCTLPAVPPPEGQSADAYKDDFSVNIHDDVVDTFYDSANNVYYYIFVTVDGIEKMLIGDQAQTVGAGSMVTTYSAVNLKDCALKAGPLALCTSLPTEGGQLQITCRNNQKEDITMDQFVGITDTTFAGMARSNTSFDWFRADEAATLERFTNSYAVFEGRRDINASNIKNNFMQDAAGVFVTRNPTLERCAVGGTASFYAYANAYDGVVWSFVSADGKQTYNAAQFMQAYGGTVSGEYSTDLQIANVNQSMNGCSVYATFSYKGMLARSCHANLYVWQNVPQGYVNYTYGIKDSRVQTPVSNLGTVYVNYNIQGWTCPSCGAWARGDECWNCGYKPGAVPGDIQGWTCPNCGSWARGDECWSCGYRPGTGTGEIMGWTCPSCGSWARGDECWNCGYKPGSGTGGGGSYDINGWTCPYCGSWTRGSECWNCGYSARYGTATLNGGGGNITGDDGDQGYTPIENNDISGWTCPYCGSWTRGEDCWNCGYSARYGTATLNGGGGNITGDDGDQGYTPIEGQYIDDDGDAGYTPIEGQYIDDDGDAGYTPIEGQYIDDDGDAGYTPIEEDDISGFSCPVCGEWIRGGECWNCGYTM